jgi:hypothetical protein
VVANLLAEMCDAQNDALEFAPRQDLELPIAERPTRDLEQELRDRERARLHARREAAGEDDHLSRHVVERSSRTRGANSW